MIFVVDENMPPWLAGMIDCYEQGVRRGHRCLHARDLGFAGVPDEEWIKKLDDISDRVSILTGDKAILRTANEKAAVVFAKVHFFRFAPGWSKINARDKALELLKIWDKIEIESRHETPCVYGVKASGSIVRLRPTSDY
ncbi:MAG: hypothetical protein P1V97_30480 [Planctomycetota bacterium]|nr:hypothetical protein [Planctomycetota bacterium]